MHAWRFITNYNLPGRAKFNAQSHYDIGGTKGESLYDLFLDKKHRQYSCAYFKKGKDSEHNEQLIKVRSVFDSFNLIEGLHTLYAQKNPIYKNILKLQKK